ncbi:MAG: XRE family transcriptional regulator [Nitrospirota bacterium]
MDFSYIGDRLRRLMDSAALTEPALAKKAGVGQATINRILNGSARPEHETIVKIARGLGIPPEALTCIDDYISTILINISNSCDGVDVIPIFKGKIPIISWVKAGELHEPIDLYQPGFSDKWISYDINDNLAFALSIQGDSMSPIFENGDVIIVSPSKESQSGDYIVAKYKDNVTFKKYKKTDNRIMLIPLNISNHEIVEITGSDLMDFKIVGKVVGKYTKY